MHEWTQGIWKEIMHERRAQGRYHLTREKDCKKVNIALSRKVCKKLQGTREKVVQKRSDVLD